MKPFCGLETAGDLVLALRAGLENLQAMSDTVFDTLIVSRFEMQRRKVREAAPVAAIQPPAARQEQAHGQGFVIALCQHDQHVLPQVGGCLLEK